MKKLVFGAMISALSFSAFATDLMHVDSTNVNVHIVSTGTEVEWVPCTTASVTGDGASVIATADGFDVALNSLHYNSSFSVCAKFELDGGYSALDDAGYKIKVLGGMNATPNYSLLNYLGLSGMTVTASTTCSQTAPATGWTSPVSMYLIPQAATDFFGFIKTLQGTTGLPDSCVVTFKFTENNFLIERQNVNGDVFDLDLGLTVLID